MPLKLIRKMLGFKTKPTDTSAKRNVNVSIVMIEEKIYGLRICIHALKCEESRITHRIDLALKHNDLNGTLDEYRLELKAIQSLIEENEGSLCEHKERFYQLCKSLNEYQREETSCGR